MNKIDYHEYVNCVRICLYDYMSSVYLTCCSLDLNGMSSYHNDTIECVSG